MTKTVFTTLTLQSSTSVVNYIAVGSGANFSNATESAAQSKFKTAGVFSQFGVNVEISSLDATTTFVLRKNGADVNNTVSVGSSATGFFRDTTNTDTIAVNDLMSIAIDATASTSGLIVSFPFISFLPTSVFVFQRTLTSIGSISTTQYCGFFDGNDSTESNRQYKNQIPMTLKNGFVDISTNAQTGTTDYKTRIDGADGNIVMSVATTATGIFEDVSNTDVLVADELVNWQITVGGTGSIQSSQLSLEMFSLSHALYCTSENSNFPNSVKRYLKMAGDNVSASDFRTAWITGNFLNMNVNVLTNDCDAATTVHLRKDGVTTTLTQSVPSSTTGDFLDTDTVAFVLDDEVNYEVDATASSSGSLDIRSITTLFDDTGIQLARPDGDQSVGSWTDEGGATTNLFQSIDEVLIDDADFVQSEENPATNSKYECTLQNLTDPISSINHIVRFRFKKDNASLTINLIVRLKQGVTTIASKTINGITTTFTDDGFILSGAEADNISNYNDLRLEFDADVP